VGNIGAPEIIVVLVLALLIFGPNRLPQLGRQIGRAMREFRQATSDLKSDFDLALNEDDEPRQPAAAGTPAALEAGSTGDAPSDDTANAQTDLAGFAATLPAPVAAGAAEGDAVPDAAEGDAVPDAAEGDAVPDAAEGDAVPDAAEGDAEPDAAEGDAAADEAERTLADAAVPDDAEGAPPTTDGGS
jgi:TatA/E family protein of Tat protein translocase